MTSTWDPNLYLKFGNERTQPSFDLIARITLPAPASIVDLGCGTGNGTEALRRRWPAADVTGLDNSPEMLKTAARDFPAGPWVLADIATWAPDAPVDLVFSNATLQWVKGHPALMPGLLGFVAEGGALAVQMPHSGKMVVRKLILATAEDAAWSDRLASSGKATAIESTEAYYDMLRPNSARLDVWEIEYMHVMAGPDAIIEWIRATSLRPFLDALASPAERAAFEAQLRARIEDAFPRRIDGNVLFPFKRLFFIAYR
ncbi:MAG: methyltransferase domain-containing protein [Thermoflexales bacterium]